MLMKLTTGDDETAGPHLPAVGPRGAVGGVFAFGFEYDGEVSCLLCVKLHQFSKNRKSKIMENSHA